MRYLEKLVAWKKGYDLTLLVYRATKGFPSEERYGLTSQMRRAAMSVPANIAEGRARKTTKDYMRFLYIARGSLQELVTYIYLAKDLGYLAESDFVILISHSTETSQFLRKLIEGLQVLIDSSVPKVS